MIRLEEKDYDKVSGPLHEVNINTLFAENVVRQDMPGAVYVDDAARPEVFYIAHPYGMSILFGDTEKEAFNRALRDYLLDNHKTRTGSEWLQVYPDAWNERIRRILGPGVVRPAQAQTAQGGSDAAGPFVIEHERVNFAFDRHRYLNSARQADSADFDIVRTSKDMFDRIPGSVVPKHFWRDGAAFEQAGIGYSLICNGDIAATAFSALRNEKELEIGIETAEKYQGNGFAQKVCSALIDDCLNRGLEPVWACRRGNEGSYRLAQKLGFVPSLTIPYYCLPAGG